MNDKIWWILHGKIGRANVYARTRQEGFQSGHAVAVCQDGDGDAKRRDDVVNSHDRAAAQRQIVTHSHHRHAQEEIAANVGAALTHGMWEGALGAAVTDAPDQRVPADSFILSCEKQRKAFYNEINEIKKKRNKKEVKNQSINQSINCHN